MVDRTDWQRYSPLPFCDARKGMYCHVCGAGAALVYLYKYIETCPIAEVTSILKSADNIFVTWREARWYSWKVIIDDLQSVLTAIKRRATIRYSE